MDKKIKKILEDVRHEFTTLTGLGVFDKANAKTTWELDYTLLIQKIDSLLAEHEQKEKDSNEK